jgi:hypothetical protein
MPFTREKLSRSRAAEYIPHRDKNYDSNWHCWQSRNYRVFISLGGDVYRAYVGIGPFVMLWNAPKPRETEWERYEAGNLSLRFLRDLRDLP